MKDSRKWRWLTLVLALAGAPLQANEVVQGDVIPPGLRDLPQATGMCTGDEEVAPVAADEVAPDFSCRVAVADVQLLLAKPDALVIDLRPKSEFDIAHIDGALPMSLAELRSRAWLRKKTLVLVGDGRGEGELYSACSRLKRDGVQDVHVLHGGLQAWRRAGRAVVGTLPDPVRLAQLTSAQLFQESGLSSNLVLLLPSAKSMQASLPRAVLLPTTGDAAIQRAITARRAQAAPLTAVVLVSGGPLRNADVERWLTAFDVPVLLHDGAPDEYARYLTTLQGMWQSRARGPRKPGCNG